MFLLLCGPRNESNFLFFVLNPVPLLHDDENMFSAYFKSRLFFHLSFRCTQLLLYVLKIQYKSLPIFIFCWKPHAILARTTVVFHYCKSGNWDHLHCFSLDSLFYSNDFANVFEFLNADFNSHLLYLIKTELWIACWIPWSML